jgi:dTDP-4-dehydrorhamnose reductase
MRLLVTGAGGMLGVDVVEAAGAAGHDAIALARADLDVTDRGAVERAIAAERPDAVVNCAAWTDVDGAEDHEAEATAVNGDGAGHVAAAAERAGAFCVHVSSDYVFDGRASEPYAEDAGTNPLGAYARSKLAGERAVLASAPGAAVVRSAWLFGARGRNFVATMLRLGREREEIAVVDDQVGSPTWTGHLAPALVAVAERRVAGILHVAGAGACSWRDLAAATMDAAGLPCRIVGQSTAQAGRPAPRPASSVLVSTRPDAPALPDWREGLAGYLAAVGAGAAR